MPQPRVLDLPFGPIAADWAGSRKLQQKSPFRCRHFGTTDEYHGTGVLGPRTAKPYTASLWSEQPAAIEPAHAAVRARFCLLIAGLWAREPNKYRHEEGWTLDRIRHGRR